MPADRQTMNKPSRICPGQLYQIADHAPRKVSLVVTFTRSPRRRGRPGSQAHLPAAPTEIRDVMAAAEIRAHVARQKSQFDFAVKNMSDPRVLGRCFTRQLFYLGSRMSI